MGVRSNPSNPPSYAPANHMFLCTHRELLNRLLLSGTVHVRLHKIIGWTYNLIQDMLMPKHPEIVEEASSLI